MIPAVLEFCGAVGKKMLMNTYCRLLLIVLGSIALGSIAMVVTYIFAIGHPCEKTPPPPNVFSYPRPFTPFEYNINHPTMCQKDGPVHLMIMVVSSPTNFEVRMAIRKTWGTIIDYSRSVRLVFLLGKPISIPISDMGTDVDGPAVDRGSVQNDIVEENSLFSDIIQEDFDDSFANLTLKSVMMLRWLVTFCPKVRFALKIDDDCFLNPFHLLEYLASPEVISAPPAAIFGELFNSPDHRKPHRCPGSKWYLSPEEYADDMLPPYLNGVTYVMTGKAVALLYQAAFRRPLINLQDVFVTGLCADDAGVKKINSNDFGKRWLYPPTCVTLWYPNFITYHALSSTDSAIMWRKALYPEFDPCQRQ